MTGAANRDELLEMVRDAEAMYFVWNGVPLDAGILAAGARLRWIHVGSTGVEKALIPELVESDITVTNARDVHAVPVTEHAFAQILTLAKCFHVYGRQQVGRVWQRGTGDILAGKVLGIIGFGSIGRELARRARAFGMKVLAVGAAARAGRDGQVLGPEAMAQVLAQSDYVAICVPLTARTRGFFDRSNIFSIKKGSYLVNIARGGIVDETALVEALTTGHLAGAAFDVFAEEPLPADSPLWALENLLITPHVAGAIPNHREVLAEHFAENLRRWIAGEPLLNVVDKRRGY